MGSAVYFPFKAAFCIVGGLSSGVAFIFAGPQTATKVANAACRGTWAITPDVVKGKERVQFIGAAPGRAGSPGEPRSGQ